MEMKEAGARLIEERFHALTHRNFRYYWFGQCVSLIGTWMQNIGQSWLVLTLTNSPALLGWMSAVQFVPVTFFSLFAGVWIDKFPKKRILIITQTVSMILALLLAVLVFTDTIRYGYLLILGFLLGVTNAFDLPTRQSFTIEIVGKEDLLNAVALNSATFNLARILGPVIGAVMMAYLGAGWCFLLNGLSFIAVIYGLIHIKAMPYVRKKKPDSGVFKEIREGFVYMARNPVLGRTILLVAVIGTLAYNYGILIPVFTKNILHMQEKSYGLLMSCLGAGSLIGALSMSFLSKGGPRQKFIMWGCLIIGALLMLLGFSHVLWLTGVLLAVNGLFNILFTTNCNSTLQMYSGEEYRARVMSMYSFVFAGSAPVGSLFAGYTADRLGADGAFLVNGGLAFVLCAVILIYFAKKKTEPDRLEGAQV